MSERSPIIEIHDFSFLIGAKRILDRISLSVAEGGYVSIVGPNGAGKTTLIRCLNRILTGGEGDVRVGGKTLGDFPQRELARWFAYVPQADGRQAPFTVYEFVLMGRYPYLSPFATVRPEDVQAVDQALDKTGVTCFKDRFMDTLSGGERQKVFLAAALAQEAKILLLDEPTTFLDPRHQAEIHGILKRAHREEGVTIVCATHDVNGALAYSDRIMALREGGVVFNGTPEEFAQNEVLKKVYDFDFFILKHPQTGGPLLVPSGG